VRGSNLTRDEKMTPRVQHLQLMYKTTVRHMETNHNKFNRQRHFEFAFELWIHPTLDTVDGNHAQNCYNERSSVRVYDVSEEVDIQLNTTDNTTIS